VISDCGAISVTFALASCGAIDSSAIAAGHPREIPVLEWKSPTTVSETNAPARSANLARADHQARAIAKSMHLAKVRRLTCHGVRSP
jgi:hypothetical protein